MKIFYEAIAEGEHYTARALLIELMTRPAYESAGDEAYDWEALLSKIRSAVLSELTPRGIGVTGCDWVDVVVGNTLTDRVKIWLSLPLGVVERERALRYLERFPRE